MMRRFDLGAPGRDGEPQRLGFEDFAVLTNATYDTTGDYKYRGTYEGIAALTGRLCQTDGQRQQARFFEYLVFCVMVRNGDAHLKNFGLLYEDPTHPASVCLSPLYDVITTTVYDYEDRRTGRMRVDRELALKLNKSKSYPTREELVAFGRGHWWVLHPAQVIERIAQGMTEAQHECRGLFPHAFGERMAAEWNAGHGRGHIKGHFIIT